MPACLVLPRAIALLTLKPLSPTRQKENTGAADIGKFFERTQRTVEIPVNTPMKVFGACSIWLLLLRDDMLIC